MKRYFLISALLTLLLLSACNKPKPSENLQTKQEPTSQNGQKNLSDEETQILLEEGYEVIYPDADGKICVEWLEICFSAPLDFYIYHSIYDDGLAITKDKPSELAFGDAGFAYSHISNEGAYESFEELKADTDAGNFIEYKVLEKGKNIVFGKNTFYKVVVNGYGESQYDFYYIDKNGHLYEFKAGYEEEQIMIDLLKSLEFS